MTGDLRGARGDDDRADIALHDDLAVRVGDGDRVVDIAVAHQRLARGAAGAHVARLEGCGGQVEKGALVRQKPLGDRGLRAAQYRRPAGQASLQEPAVQGVDVRGFGHRHHEGPAGKADHPLDLALVVALPRPTEAVLEQVVGLQPREHPAPRPGPVAQDLRHRERGVVIEDRPRHAAEEGEGRDMPVAQRLRRLGKVRLHEDRVALRQVHHEEMHLPLLAPQHRPGLAEIRLRMARRMRQRHECLPQRQPPRPHVIANRRVSAPEASLVAQPLEDPPHRVPLLLRRLQIRTQNLVDETGMRVELRSPWRRRAPVARRFGMLQNLRHRPAIDPEPSPRLPLAQSFTNTARRTRP